MASSPPHHPASEPHRQATEDEVQAWVETGQRPRSSRPKSSRVKVRDEVRPKSSRKKQQAWADEPGPLQAVLDMHASAVEQLHHVSYTSSKLQEEFDVVRAQFETATVQTQYEDSVIRNIENTADQLQLNLTRIEDRVVQLIRANFDQEDHAAMQQLHRHIEDQLRQEVQDAYARNAKERKMAERVPDLLKELDDHKEILDETVTDRERYKLDVQLLQDKVRMVTSRAESAEQMREQALDREAALVKRVEQLSEESNEQRKAIAKLTGEVKVVNQLKADLARFQKSSTDANMYLDEAVRGRKEMEVEVAKLTDQLTESETEVRELQLHIYQGDLETRGIRDSFQKLVETVEQQRVQRQEEAEAFAAQRADLQQIVVAHEEMRIQEMDKLAGIEASLLCCEGAAYELSSRVPDLLQKERDAVMDERLKEEMLQFKVDGLLQKFKALQQELQEKKEQTASLAAELASKEDTISGQALEWNAATESMQQSAGVMLQLSAVLDQIENALHKAAALGATMQASSDEAMGEVRGHLLEQQREDAELRETISNLTNKLNRAQQVASNSYKAKAAAFADRDAIKKLMWRAQEQEKINEQLLKKEAGRLPPIGVLVDQVGNLIAAIDERVRQRAPESSETEQARLELREALAAKGALIQRVEELEDECSHAHQDLTELEHQYRAQRDEMSAAVATALAHLAAKKEVVDSLACSSREALNAAADYQECASTVCRELLSQIELHEDEIHSLKRRRKARGKRRKSASPHKSKSSSHGSWAQLSVRTHENAMGSTGCCECVGGWEMRGGREGKWRGITKRRARLDKAGPQTEEQTICTDSAGSNQHGHRRRGAQELPVNITLQRARATSAVPAPRLPDTRIMRGGARIRATSAHGFGVSGKGRSTSPAIRPRSPDGCVLVLV